MLVVGARDEYNGDAMPELPEVETVLRGLQPVLEGRRLIRVDQRRPDLRFPFPDGFVEQLEGSRVVSMERRAKYMLLRLDRGLTWLVHLGMSGRFTIDGKQERNDQNHATSGQAGHNSGWALIEPHDHVIVETEDMHRIVYNDTRRFGFMDLFPTNEEATHKHLRGIGPEPLSDDFNVEGFLGAIAGKKSPIKAALLDQTVVAGLGNIYVSEALWRAGISPKRLAANIGPQRARRLVPHVKTVLQDAIAAGGSSLRDYVQATGELGYFQHAFDAYDRDGEICRKDGCHGVIRKITQSGRSTYFCPIHQR